MTCCGCTDTGSARRHARWPGPGPSSPHTDNSATMQEDEMTTDSDMRPTTDEAGGDEPVEPRQDDGSEQVRPRWRRVLAVVTTALAFLLVLYALVGPNNLDQL